MYTSFEWDQNKNSENQHKHGVGFEEAQEAFFDPDRLILVDTGHGTPEEERYFCVGRVEGGILTVRFTYRVGAIRVFGAGFWRKYRKVYLERSKEE